MELRFAEKFGRRKDFYAIQPRRGGSERRIFRKRFACGKGFKQRKRLKDFFEPSFKIRGVLGGGGAEKFSQPAYRALHKTFGIFKSTVQKKSPMEIFNILGNVKDSARDITRVKNIYRKFISINHLDKLPKSLSAEDKEKINSCGIQLKSALDMVTSSKKDKESKELGMKTAVNISKKRGVCKSLLEQKEYKEAYALLSEIDKKDMKKDTTLMLLYMWLALKAPI